jgi:hypothetical protein
MNHNRGDVYSVLYPFDDKDESKVRPAIIFDTRDGRSIVIKVTSHAERENDDKDVPIIHWDKAGLDEPSVARCRLYIPLDHDKIFKYLGTLHDEDLLNVLEKFYS